MKYKLIILDDTSTCVGAYEGGIKDGVVLMKRARPDAIKIILLLTMAAACLARGKPLPLVKPSKPSTDARLN